MASKNKNQLDIFKQQEEEEVKNMFTDEQSKYIFYKGMKSIIFSATAGSGKTFCAVHRLKELLKRGVDPKKIIFFSFTNAAVDELKERVNNPDIRITTIHSFCFWMLHSMGKFKKVTNFHEFIEWYKKKNEPSSKASEKERFAFEKLISNLYDDAEMLDSNISSYKLQTADGIKVKMPEYFIQYSKFLREEKKRDFSDILLDVRDLLKENKWLKMFKDKYDYLFIDEYQDTSAIQMEILLRLNARCYYLIGDKNQSIYGYSGSNCDHIESMLEKRRKVERMTLTTNFRSADIIVKNSNKFSSLEAKSFNTFDGEINEKFIDFDELIELINNEDEVAVLARTNFAVKLIELNLLKRKVPMKYFNYLKPKDIEDIKNRKINPLIRKRLEYVLEDFSGTVDDLVKFIEDNQDKNSFVTTIHKSKGKEYHTCTVVNSVSEELLEENKIVLPDKTKDYYTFYPGMSGYQEEKNIHYVAVSRPKHKLYYMLLKVK
jgi:superfamily I DNA/RNA helicase